jgi:hypothetical protein
MPFLVMIGDASMHASKRDDDTVRHKRDKSTCKNRSNKAIRDKNDSPSELVYSHESVFFIGYSHTAINAPHPFRAAKALTIAGPLSGGVGDHPWTV